MQKGSENVVDQKVQEPKKIKRMTAILLPGTSGDSYRSKQESHYW